MAREEAIAARLMEDFKAQWAPELEKASEASELLQAVGGSGFDLDPGLWAKRGWAELEKLRPLLDQLKPFEALVKKLGRGGCVRAASWAAGRECPSHPSAVLPPPPPLPLPLLLLLPRCCCRCRCRCFTSARGVMTTCPPGPTSPATPHDRGGGGGAGGSPQPHPA
eukprot:COSAG01_NODE_8201_length_2877_cov_66.935565_2_plen_166_part_00